MICNKTEIGFDAVINVPLVPYIGEYYCDPGWGEDPLDSAIAEFRNSYPNVYYQGHIEYRASFVRCINGKIKTGGGTAACYDVSSDTET